MISQNEMVRGLIAFLVGFALAAFACAHKVGAAECLPHLARGTPSLTADAHTTPICHRGYFVLHDDDLLIPRYVAYVLTGPHTLGCEKRSNKFHPDENLPADRRSTSADYLKSGYDRGHQAPAGDFEWSKALSLETFSMANMAPQRPGLNRLEWERLEETVRGWAWKRGEVTIYVGPVLSDNPKTIGRHHVAVPTAFFKVVADDERGDVLAFLMPNRTIPKGPLAPWQTTVADVEQKTGIKLPTLGDHETKSPIWKDSRLAWQKKHAAICHSG
jgi:endonuclease G